MGVSGGPNDGRQRLGSVAFNRQEFDELRMVKQKDDVRTRQQKTGDEEDEVIFRSVGPDDGKQAGKG